MDEALIEHPEHDIDHDDRRQDQQGLVGERAAELRGAAGEGGGDRRRQADGALRLGDGVDGGAQRVVGRHVEGQGDHREAPEMADRQRRGLGVEIGDRAQQHRRPAVRLHIERAQGGGIGLEPRIELQDHVVLVELGVDGRDLPLPEGVVQRVDDGVDRDAELGGLVAEDRHPRLQAAAIVVGGEIGQFRTLPQRVQRASSTSPPALPCRDPAARIGTGYG